MTIKKKQNLIFIFLYSTLFLLGIKALFHGFPDIERFFAEWMDEKLTLTYIMKFGTLNFAPTEIWHPPLYHYLTFIPIAMFYVIGKLTGLFYDKIEFVRFYFSNTHYFFFIGRTMSYIFYWLTAAMIFKIARLFYNRLVSHITTLSYLLIPRFIFDFSTTRPETLLFLNVSVFFYFFLKYYLNNKRKYLFIAAFVLGVSTATKYNALYLCSIFVPLLIFQLKNRRLYSKDFKEFLALYTTTAFFIFLGFFICDPFFVIKFNKYFYNLMMYSTVEMKHYWTGDSAIFVLTHVKELISLIYVNFFGFFILLLGSWSLLRKDKRLFIYVFFTILVYEIYFGIFLNNQAPLRYLNPLLPLAMLIFSGGINFIVTYRRKLMPFLIIFGMVLFYNYLDIWRGLSVHQTYIQEARAFIEETIPEFTTICITSVGKLPQLNMTEESYHRLIKTAPIWNIKGHELTYKDMDKQDYDSVFKKMWVQSLMKKPQYNLLRWNSNIKTEKEALAFFKRNNVKYIMGTAIPMVDNKRLVDTEMVSLLREFKPKNRKVYGDFRLYLSKTNLSR